MIYLPVQDLIIICDSQNISYIHDLETFSDFGLTYITSFHIILFVAINIFFTIH